MGGGEWKVRMGGGERKVRKVGNSLNSRRQSAVRNGSGENNGIIFYVRKNSDIHDIMGVISEAKSTLISN
jgi:hypothetical protein